MTDQHTLHKQQRLEQGTKSVLMNLVSNVVLSAIKVISGLLGNSYALIADGVESLLDVFSSSVVWGGLKIGAIPADKNHPFGHGKAESLAAMVASIVLILVALAIAVESIMKVLTPHNSPKAFTLIVLILVVVVKEMMYRLLWKTGNDIESLSVRADAWHSRSDALTSLAAFIGISIALAGGRGYESADGWAALFASAVIFFNGSRILKFSLGEMMDSAVPQELESKVRIIGEQIPGVAHIEKCRIRKSGMDFFVEIHISVDGHIPVIEGHRIAHDVKQALLDSHLHITDVTTHIEPDSY